jgi:hypothetical protein
MWTADYGYYVFATAHYDYDDPNGLAWCDDTEHGYDETAAHNIVGEYKNDPSGPGWNYTLNLLNVFNKENHVDVVDGRDHTRNSNGLLDGVHVK